ncbi:MAG TPA: ATP-binding protein [Opitutaceae bacterium]|nr:ATP-binding protein [Opitutaceae bacterium]
MAEAPARLLIVDDEEPHLRALCNTLRDQGFETAGFTSGKEALAALRTTPFDLLLTDLMMPEMDGIALLKAALEADPRLTGIMMTGAGSIASAVEAMKSGALDYILKPCKVSSLLPVLSRGLMVRRLRAENAELARRVQDRTAELETANKELEAFSYSVSHDLRAPLRHIDGFANLLLTGHAAALPPDAQRLLNQVIASSRRMGQLIDDLLRLSKSSRQPLNLQPVPLGALVEEVLAELRRDAGERRIEVRLGPLPECMVDRALLRQVFVNLLSNAFKFTRQRETAVIEVDVRPEGSELVCRVKDNGAGFDPRYAERLFGVFQRLHRAEQFEGTGVGLSIVQRIIHRHGGRIWAESALDAGAAFYFTLPASAAVRADQPAA